MLPPVPPWARACLPCSSPRPGVTRHRCRWHFRKRSTTSTPRCLRKSLTASSCTSSADGHPGRVPDELSRVLALGLAIGRASGGAFDIFGIEAGLVGIDGEMRTLGLRPAAKHRRSRSKRRIRTVTRTVRKGTRRKGCTPMQCLGLTALQIGTTAAPWS